MSETISKCIEGLTTILVKVLELFKNIFYSNGKLNMFGWLLYACIFLLIIDLVVNAIITLIYGGEDNENN